MIPCPKLLMHHSFVIRRRYLLCLSLVWPIVYWGKHDEFWPHLTIVLTWPLAWRVDDLDAEIPF